MHGVLGEDLLMFLQFLGGFGRASGLLIQAAKLVMRRGMLRLKLSDGFELADGIIYVPEAFFSQAELKIERRNGGIDLPRILKSLNCFFCPVEVKVRATHQIIRGGVVMIERERPLAFLNHLLVFSRKQVSVRQIQLSLEALRNQLPGLQVDRDRI